MDTILGHLSLTDGSTREVDLGPVPVLSRVSLGFGWSLQRAP